MFSKLKEVSSEVMFEIILTWTLYKRILAENVILCALELHIFAYGDVLCFCYKG